jgi:hypothetical protein
LLGLQALRAKGIIFDNLHSGNIILFNPKKLKRRKKRGGEGGGMGEMEDEVQLSDIETSLLSLPPASPISALCHRLAPPPPYETIDLFLFGTVLFEMTFGFPLTAQDVVQNRESHVENEEDEESLRSSNYRKIPHLQASIRLMAPSSSVSEELIDLLAILLENNGYGSSMDADYLLTEHPFFANDPEASSAPGSNVKVKLTSHEKGLARTLRNHRQSEYEGNFNLIPQEPDGENEQEEQKEGSGKYNAKKSSWATQDGHRTQDGTTIYSSPVSQEDDFQSQKRDSRRLATQKSRRKRK